MATAPRRHLDAAGRGRAGGGGGRPAGRRLRTRGCWCWSGRATTAVTRCTPGPCSRGAGLASRRCCSPTRRTRPGSPRCGRRWAGRRPAGRHPGPTWSSTGSSASAAGPGCDAGARRGAGAGRRPDGRRGRARAGSPSTPAGSRAARHGRRHGHVRHPQGRATWSSRPPRRAGSCTWSTSAWTSPRPRSRRCRPTTSPRCCRRPAPDAQKYTRGVVGVRAGSARYPGAGVLSIAGAACGLAGMVRYAGGAPDAVRAAHPEVVVGDGRVQAWVVGSGGDADGGRRCCRGAGRRGAAGRGRRRAEAPRRRRSAAPALLTPHAGELAADARASNEPRWRPASSRHRAARGRRYAAVVLLKGRHTLVAAPGRPGAGDHHRHALAGDRRRRRRARRAVSARCSPPGSSPFDAARRRAPGCTAPLRRTPRRRWRPASPRSDRGGGRMSPTWCRPGCEPTRRRGQPDARHR